MTATKSKTKLAPMTTKVTSNARSHRELASDIRYLDIGYQISENLADAGFFYLEVYYENTMHAPRSGSALSRRNWLLEFTVR